MKLAFRLLILLITNTSFALPCPNGGGILYKGDSPEEVVKECGQPTSQKINTQIMSSQQTSVYYRRHAFDGGYAEIDVYYYNNKVSRIHVTDYYPLPYPFYVCQVSPVQLGSITTVQSSCGNVVPYDAQFTALCGNTIIGLGDDISRVEYICGPPASKSEQKITNEVREYTYGTDNPQTIIFQNGKLIDWR